PFDCSHITLTLPVGSTASDLTPADRLTSIRGSVPVGSGWSIAWNGDASFTARPSDVRVPAGASITLYLAGVQVNDLTGLAVVTVEEGTLGLPSVVVSVSKTPPAPGAAVRIGDLMASPFQVAGGGTATLQ